MAEIVLVHGAWQGAWCWERVIPLLEEAGHRVEAPTLRGSGDRAGELDPDVTLDDHIDEISEVVASLPERRVILVGHFEAPARIPERKLASLPRTFVSGTAEGYPARAAFGALAARAADDGCRLVEVATGHDVMLEAAEELTRSIAATAGP